MKQATLRHCAIWCAFLLATWLIIPVRSTVAATERCFPQTRQCIDGRFRTFWEQNGGLEVFGYPLTAASPTVNEETGQTYLTQWFERYRFELHPEYAPPYDVLLGRLGATLLAQGLQPVATEDEFGRLPADRHPQAGCRWFPQTRYNVCAGFKRYWESHGLADPRMTSEQRSLALFGNPLSGVFYFYNSSGRWVQAQYFERARIELAIVADSATPAPRAAAHSLGRLGAELLFPQTVWQTMRALLPTAVPIYQPLFVPAQFGPPRLLNYSRDAGGGYSYTIEYLDPAAEVGYDTLAFVLGEGYQAYGSDPASLFAAGTSTTEPITIHGVGATLVIGPRTDPHGNTWTLFVLDWQEQGLHYRIMADSPTMTRADFLRVVRQLAPLT